MQITISGKQIGLSDELQSRVAGQLGVIGGKYFDHAIEARVTFGMARELVVCNVDVHASGNLTARGQGAAVDARTAFASAARHVAKQLRRYRRRVNDHFRDLMPRGRGQSAPEREEKQSGWIDAS